MTSSLVLSVIGVPWLGAILVWIIGDRRERAQHITAAVTSVIAAAAAALLLRSSAWGTTSEVAFSMPFGPFIGDLTFVADSLAVFLTIIATTVGSLTVIFSAGYMRSAAQLGRYYALVLAFIGAMCGLVLSGNLFFLFLFWEITAFCSYALIAFHNDDPKAVSAGIKALIVTQLGGIGLLIGIILAAAYLPDLQVSTLLEAAGGMPPTILAIIGFGFLLAAMAKSAQVPLHIWLPDAMEAPTPVSALIHAATMVNAGVYLLARFYPSFFEIPYWTTVVVFIGVISALLAALMATTSNDIKRVLAFSTVSQLGYMVAAVGLGAIFESQFYLFSHALFKALLFLGAGAIIHELGTRDTRVMGGLWRRMPAIAVPFLIGAAALVGLPFFNGFWSKELLLEVALEHGSAWVYATLVIVAGITAFYTARLCRMVFFLPPSPEETAHVGQLSSYMIFPLLVLAAGVSLGWLLAEPFAAWMQQTLPFHADFLLPGMAVENIISTHTILTFSTLIVLSVTGIGLVLGWRAGGNAREDKSTSRFARVLSLTDSLFNTSAQAVTGLTQNSAALLQRTQTGQLNWNIAAITLGLIALLLIILQGVL